MRIGEEFDSLFEIKWFIFLNMKIEDEQNVIFIKPFLHHFRFSMLRHVQEENVFVRLFQR
jgi:hypothetical protein